MPQVADPKETLQLIRGADRFLTRWLLKALHPGALAVAEQLKQDYDFDGIRLVLPTTLFEERHLLDLDGTEVHLIHVGPCHQIGDTIVHVPKEKVVFAGDVIFRECTPMGWNGSYEKRLKTLDVIISLDPDVIVPGHGPVCGVEGAMEMKAYLEYVREESGRFFGPGLSALEASKRIDFGPYGGWRAPARLYYERRAGLPGVLPRGCGRAMGPRKGLRRGPRRGQGRRHRGRVLTWRSVQAASPPLAVAAGVAEAPRMFGTRSADAWQDNLLSQQEKTRS